MSNRTYANFILLDRVLSNLPTNSTLDAAMIDSVFKAPFRVVSLDCGTTIGKRLQTDYNLVGRIDLNTGLALTEEAITNYLGQGKYITHVRTSDTCGHRTGICKACYHASRPIGEVPEVSVGEIINIPATDTTPFLKYLADSFSGSLFGMKAMPVSDAPLSMAVYKNLIRPGAIDHFKQKLEGSPMMTSYIQAHVERIQDPLEKILLLLLMFGIDSAAIR